MKTKFRIKHLWKNLFTISLIAFHIHLVICRPLFPTHVDNSSAAAIIDHGHRQQVRPTVHYYDLRNVGPTEIRYSVRGGGMRRLLKNNDTLILYASSSDRDYFVDDSDVIDNENDITNYVNDAPPDDEVIVGHQVAIAASDRNLVRKRRQPDAAEPQQPHRRRRQRNRHHHRLVLKARDRNHLSSNDGDLKDRRGRFLIKSDSPGYVITSASEVKKDWCRTLPLKQKISEPGCRSRVVRNNFCYGQCNSFFIPHTGRTDDKVAFQSCAFCKPFRQHWGNVTLNCPGRNPPKVEKTVLFVETCRCITEVLQ